MIVIGLTGSIGMGKSTLASQLALLGAKICNADAIVHELMGKEGKAVADIERLFPGVTKNGSVDRKALGEIVFKDKQQLQRLEQLLHPLVVAEENRFIKEERSKGARMVVLDIPLLFETRASERCDVTLVASAPYFLQRQRVLKRPGMNEQKFARINQSQMADAKKRRRADKVVLTGLGKAVSFKTIAAWLKEYTL